MVVPLLSNPNSHISLDDTSKKESPLKKESSQLATNNDLSEITFKQPAHDKSFSNRSLAKDDQSLTKNSLDTSRDLNDPAHNRDLEEIRELEDEDVQSPAVFDAISPLNPFGKRSPRKKSSEGTSSFRTDSSYVATPSPQTKSPGSKGGSHRPGLANEFAI